MKMEIDMPGKRIDSKVFLEYTFVKGSAVQF